MKLWKKLVLGAVVVIGVLPVVGCGKTSEPAKSAKPATQTEVKISDTALRTAIDAAIPATVKSLKTVPMVRDVYIAADHSDKKVTIAVVVDNATNHAKALEIADTAIRRYAMNIQSADSNIKGPTNDRYGDAFDVYMIDIGIAPAHAVEKRDQWLYDKVIMPQMHTKQGPDWKAAARNG